MKVTLPLAEMTPSEKLETMEQLWDDLCRDPEDVLSPDWHGEVLANREQRIEDSHAQFVSLDEMKDRIRKATQ